MTYTMYPDPKIYLALLLINIAVIFVFYLAMSEMTQGKNKNLNTPNAWWTVLMVVTLALIVTYQNSVSAWALLLIIPMVNLAVAAIIDVVTNRFAHLRKIGFSNMVRAK